jgi:2-keto-3-deoxy-L-rhamnonate aldolase RhmA
LEKKMKWIRDKVLSGELMSGTFLNLGSSLTAEMAGRAGFDWVLIDLEHGAGDRQELLLQLQALESTSAAPIVRIAWNDAVLFKRILDLGPSGIMVPYVQSGEEARRAVAAMRYPPAGVRGVASMNRACGFGPGFDEYFQSANSKLLTVIQIETPTAVDNAEEIAATDGVDVLFVGPMDLSVMMGIPCQWEHPRLQAAYAKVIEACRKAGKVAGVLVMNRDAERLVTEGFSFLSLSSDGAMVAAGMKEAATLFRQLQSYRGRD